MKRGPKLKWPFRAMTYSSPGGDKIIEPTVEALEPIILRERDEYWRRGPGDSFLGVVDHRGEQHTGMIKDEPALTFFLIERHGFFFTYFQPTEATTVQFIPYAGGNCRPWVRHDIGGVSFYVPRACFVSRPFAWEIVQEFLRSKGRSNAVSWADRFFLEFPFPAAGDAPPSESDLA